MTSKATTYLALVVALALAAAVPAAAQQHKATRLGNPATRFAKPLKKPDDLRVLLRSEKVRADIVAVLQDAGWSGDVADLDRAAASAEIVPVQIAPGTTIPFMAARKNGKPYAMKDVLWAGSEAHRRVRVRVLLEVRSLSPRHAQGLRQLLGGGPRQGHDRREVRPGEGRAAPGRHGERSGRSLRDAAGRVRDHSEEPAGRQRRQALRQRQGARLRQAHERLLQVHLHGRPGSGDLRGEGRLGRRQRHDDGAGQALPADLRHHGQPASRQGRQAPHRRRLGLARRGGRQGRGEVGQGRGGGPEGRRGRHLSRWAPAA